MATRVHRNYSATLAGATLALGLLLLPAPAARADVTGGCTGSVDFSTDQVGAYTPDFDTKDNPVVVPRDEGNLAAWEGSVPGDNRDFGGKVEIKLGPAWVKVADWGIPGHDGSNTDDQRSDDGIYEMDELWDAVPKSIIQGIYQARATHSAMGVDCVANFFVEFEGNALASPIVIVAIILLVLLAYLLFLAGRRRGVAGAAFAGRPVLAVVAAFFLGIVIALLLQQFGVWPLDNLTVIVLPILLILLGLVIAKFAPFGGARHPVGAER